MLIVPNLLYSTNGVICCLCLFSLDNELNLGNILPINLLIPWILFW